MTAKLSVSDIISTVIKDNSSAISSWLINVVESYLNNSHELDPLTTNKLFLLINDMLLTYSITTTQLQSKEICSKLIHLLQINQHLPEVNNFELFPVNSKCIASYTEDNQWYTATVIEILESKQSYLIEFDGYGNQQITPIKQLAKPYNNEKSDKSMKLTNSVSLKDSIKKTTDLDRMIRGNNPNEIDARNNKILIMGTTNSGKSTLISLLKLINFSNMTSTTRNDKYYIDMIRKHTINGIIELISQSNKLYKINKFNDCFLNRNSIDIKIHIERILKFKVNLDLHDSFKGLTDSIDFIWKQPAIKATFKHGLLGKFRMIDNLDYFLDKTKEIMSEDYIKPACIDILHCKMRNTTDHNVCRYENIQVIDMNVSDYDYIERKKWYKHFKYESCHIIYCVSLNDYCKKNAMYESIELYKEICENMEKKKRKIDIDIFFTKRNKFKECLRYKSLSEFFGITKSVVLFAMKLYGDEIKGIVPEGVCRIIINYCQDIFNKYEFGWKENMNNETMSHCYNESLSFIKNLYLDCHQNSDTSVDCHSVDLTNVNDTIKTLNKIKHCKQDLLKISY
eukprot:292180_1